MTNTKLIRVVLIALFCYPAVMQAESKQFSAWTYSCNNTDQRKSCAVRHSQKFKNNSHAITLALTKPNDKPIWVLRFRSPLNVYLPDGINFKIDTEQPYKAQFMRCEKRGCFGTILFGDEQLQKLRAGITLNVTYSLGIKRKSIPIKVPLKGFSAAHKAGWPKYNPNTEPKVSSAKPIKQQAPAQKPKKKIEPPNKSVAKTLPNKRVSDTILPKSSSMTISDEPIKPSKQPEITLQLSKPPPPAPPKPSASITKDDAAIEDTAHTEAANSAEPEQSSQTAEADTKDKKWLGIFDWFKSSTNNQEATAESESNDPL